MLPEAEGTVSVTTLVRGAVALIALFVLAMAGRALWKMRRPKGGLPDTVKP
jgi:type III secretion protein J